jgi:hypothetical protein
MKKDVLGGGQPCGLAAASARGRRPPAAGGGPTKYHRLALRNSLYRIGIRTGKGTRRRSFLQANTQAEVPCSAKAVEELGASLVVGRAVQCCYDIARIKEVMDVAKDLETHVGGDGHFVAGSQVHEGIGRQAPGLRAIVGIVAGVGVKSRPEPIISG